MNYLFLSPIATNTILSPTFVHHFLKCMLFSGDIDYNSFVMFLLMATGGMKPFASYS
jgi:hypothetical protein